MPKPAFDPSQPFEEVAEPAKPKFDPSQPFEAVEDDRVSMDQLQSMETGVPAQTQQTQPSFTDSVVNFAKAGIQREFDKAKLAVDLTQKYVGRPLAKGIEAAGEAGEKYIGRPIINAMGLPLPNKGEQTAGKLLRKQALGFIAGDTYAKDTMSEAELLEAVNILEDNLGQKGSAFTMGAATELGKLPILVAGTAAPVAFMSKGGQLGEALAARAGIAFDPVLPALGKILGLAVGTGAESAAFGTAERVLTGQEASLETVEQDFKAGAVAGPLIVGAGVVGVKLAKEAAQQVKLLGQATTHFMTRYAEEMQNLVTQGVDAVRGSRLVQVPLEGITNASHVTAVMDGKVPVLLVEQIEKSGRVLQARVPVPDAAQFKAVGNFVGPDVSWSPSMEFMRSAPVDAYKAFGEFYVNRAMVALTDGKYKPLVDLDQDLTQGVRRAQIIAEQNGAIKIMDPSRAKSLLQKQNTDKLQVGMFDQTRNDKISKPGPPVPSEVSKTYIADTKVSDTVASKTLPGGAIDAAKRGQVPAGGSGNDPTLAKGMNDLTDPDLRLNELRMKEIDVGPGDDVLFGKDPNGKNVYLEIGQNRGSGYDGTPQGRLIGPDPKNPKNLLVEFKGKQLSMAANKVYSSLPPGVAKASELFNEGVPMPDVTSMWSGASPAMANDIEVAAKLAKMMAQNRDPNTLTRVLDAIMPNHLRGSLQEQIWHTSGKAAQGLSHTQDELLKFMRVNLPDKKLLSAADLDLANVGLGRMNMEQFAAKHPTVGKTMNDAMNSIIQEARMLDRAIQELGGAPTNLGKLRDSGAIDQYVAQIYRAYTLGPGKWSRIAPLEVYNVAAANIVKEMKRLKLDWNESQVAQELLDLVNADDPVARFWGSILSKPFQHLKARKELPPWLSNLLGKETSGALRMATSLANQRAIHGQLKLWDNIVNHSVGTDVNGMGINPYFSIGPRADLPAQIPNDPRKYGRAAGGYTTRELAPLLNTAKTHQATLGIWRAMGSFVKSNLLVFGGPLPWANNFIRNFEGAILSGGLDMFRPVESGAAFFEAAGEMAKWAKNPTAKGGASYMWMAKQTGAIPAGLGFTEMSSDYGRNRYMKEIAQHLGTLPTSKRDLWTMQRELMQFVTGKYGKSKDKLAAAYDAIDVFWKMSSFISLHKKFVADGHSVAKSAQLAANRINKYYPNFEHVSKLVEDIRNTPAGVFAPFITGFAESLRTKGMAVMDIKNSVLNTADATKELIGMQPPGPRRDTDGVGGRVLVASTVLASLGYMLNEQRKLNGITDEEVAAAQAIRSHREQVYRPGLVALPYRDAKGRVQFYDMGQPFADLQLLQGHPKDSLFARLTSNLALAPFSGAATEDGVRAMMNKVGWTTELPNKKDHVVPGTSGLMNLVKSLAQGGGLPKGIHALTQNYERVKGPHGMATEPLTSGQGVARSLGANVAGGVTVPGVTRDPATGMIAEASPTQMGQIFEMQGDEKTFKADLTRTLMDPRMQANPEYQKQVVDAILKAMTSSYENVGAGAEAVEAAQKGQP